MKTRYAIYFVPPQGGTLNTLGSQLLGRDIYTGQSIPTPASFLQKLQKVPMSAETWFERTMDARKYGLHATLKPPFHLAENYSEKDLLTAFASFAQKAQPCSPAGWRVERLGSFFALKPHSHGVPACIHALAQNAVLDFEPFREPLSAESKANRLAKGLTTRQQEYVERFGYPYVCDEFVFHITLCQAEKMDSKASPAQKLVCQAKNASLQSALEDFLRPSFATLSCAHISLCKSDEQGVFTVLCSHVLGSTLQP